MELFKYLLFSFQKNYYLHIGHSLLFDFSNHL